MRISVPVLLDNTVWDDEGFRSCRAAALPLPYYFSHTHPKLSTYSRDFFPNSAQALVCSLEGSSLMYLNCSPENTGDRGLCIRTRATPLHEAHVPLGRAWPLRKYPVHDGWAVLSSRGLR